MNMLVYKITNTINGKLYFGITQCSLRKRWNEHKCNALKKKKKTHLSLSILKYGCENFTIELVESCANKKEMYELEKALIKKYATQNRNNGYNNSAGGEVSSFGKTVSEEVKAKISVAMKNKKRKPYSDSAKENMRKAAVGRDMTKAVASSSNKRRGLPSHNICAIVLNKENIFSSLKEGAGVTGVSVTAISNNLRGLSKKTKAGTWEYHHKNLE